MVYYAMVLNVGVLRGIVLSRVNGMVWNGIDLMVRRLCGMIG